jgi:integral membrane protein
MNLSTPLGRYRLMAYVVGVMLIVVFIGLIPAINSMDKVVGPIHGALYIVYLLTVVNIAAKERLRFWTIVAMVVAGWVPFTSFIAERWVTRQVRSAASA